MAEQGSRIVWRDDTSLSVDGEDYDLQHVSEAVVGRLRLYKSRAMIESYLPIIAEFQGSNIFELGIFGGGSTAFFAQVCAPRRLIAVELSPDRIDPLDRLVERRGLEGSVRLHYGVDQGDRARLREILDLELGDAPLDLVIDDASHIYGPTRASFEVLFPRLRPGGLYVIEDWRSQDWFIRMFAGLIGGDRSTALDTVEQNLTLELADASSLVAPVFERWSARALTDPTAPHHDVVTRWFRSLDAADATEAQRSIRDRLTHVVEALAEDPGATSPPSMGTLAAELCMGMKSGHPALAEVAITPHWIMARRGTEPFDPASFTVDAMADDPFAILTPHDDGFGPRT